MRDENMRLQRKLQMEVERREALCRHLSESESSLEMEEERLYNESLLNHSVNSLNSSSRQRTISSPVPHSPSSSRPISPGSANSTGYPGRCMACGQLLSHRRQSGFIKPAIPLMGGTNVGVGAGAGGGNPSTQFGSGNCGGGGLTGLMPSNRHSTENNSIGSFSPNHSSAALMHTFLQPASPMDTSVYKE